MKQLRIRYTQHASPVLNSAVHISLLFFSSIFLFLCIILQGDILTGATVALHGLYFFLTIDQHRVQKKSVTPIFSSLHHYRIARALILLLIGGVVLFLHQALGSPWVLFDVSLWAAIIE